MICGRGEKAFCPCNCKIKSTMGIARNWLCEHLTNSVPFVYYSCSVLCAKVNCTNMSMTEVVRHNRFSFSTYNLTSCYSSGSSQISLPFLFRGHGTYLEYTVRWKRAQQGHTCACFRDGSSLSSSLPYFLCMWTDRQTKPNSAFHHKPNMIN